MTPLQMALAYVLEGVVRGLLVGAGTFALAVALTSDSGSLEAYLLGPIMLMELWRGIGLGETTGTSGLDRLHARKHQLSHRPCRRSPEFASETARPFGR